MWDFFKFKYISCYSLSMKKGNFQATKEHLNTSHVILYLMCIYGYKWRKGHLNTSHVILYPISLKFTENQLSFKYISCYSLSKNCQRGILV